MCIVHYQVGEEIECTTFQIKYKLSSFEKFASLISHFFSVKREGANFTTESGNFSAKESLGESRDCISIQVDHSSPLHKRVFKNMDLDSGMWEGMEIVGGTVLRFDVKVAVL